MTKKTALEGRNARRMRATTFLARSVGRPGDSFGVPLLTPHGVLDPSGEL